MRNDNLSSHRKTLAGTPPFQVSTGWEQRRDGIGDGALVETFATVGPYQDTFGRDLAAHLYRTRATQYPHLRPELWPEHERVDLPKIRKTFVGPNGRRMKVNPFEPDKPKAAGLPKWSRLRSEVPAIYSAMSFAMWQYGVVMNAHLTILWKMLGITDHNKATRLLGLYNHEARKWLDVGSDDQVVRRRRSRRVIDAGSIHTFVYVHENSQERGFHTHELMHLPVRRAKEFAEWSKGCLARLAECARPDESAVHFSPCSPKGKIFHPYEGAREAFAVDRQWRWFKYITKNLDPEFKVQSPVDRAWHAARDVFQMKKPFIASGPVRCRKLAGYSEHIGPGAQRRAGFKWKFESGAWDRLYDGSELDEYRAFVTKVAQEEHEQKERAEMDDILSRLII